MAARLFSVMTRWPWAICGLLVFVFVTSDLVGWSNEWVYKSHCQCGCFLTTNSVGIVDAYLCRAVWCSYNGSLKKLSVLFQDADMILFRSMVYSTHGIHQLFPPLKFMPIKLCTCHYTFALPYSHNAYCHYNLYKHLFVLRCIFVVAY